MASPAAFRGDLGADQIAVALRRDSLQLKRAVGGFERMDLPPCPIGAGFENPIEIVRRVLWRRIGTDMTGAKTILNGQQIHTTLLSLPDRKHGCKPGRWLETRLFTENLLNQSGCRA